MTQSTEHAHCFPRNFRTHTITREDCQLKTHGSAPILLPKIINLLSV
jgi:hypothetical protein